MRFLTRFLFGASAVLAGLVVGAGAALAQINEGSWVKPATDLAGTLESGLVQIGGPVIGIGIIVLGIIGALAGRIEWSRVAMVVVGGLLIMVGPAALRALLGTG